MIVFVASIMQTGYTQMSKGPLMVVFGVKANREYKIISETIATLNYFCIFNRSEITFLIKMVTGNEEKITKNIAT